MLCTGSPSSARKYSNVQDYVYVRKKLAPVTSLTGAVDEFVEQVRGEERFLEFAEVEFE